jgi:hypothetical protein
MACFGLLRIISGTPIAQPRYQPKLPIMASRRTVVDNKYCLVEEHPACDTRIRVSQAAAINSLRMANALLAPG